MPAHLFCSYGALLYPSHLFLDNGHMHADTGYGGTDIHSPGNIFGTHLCLRLSTEILRKQVAEWKMIRKAELRHVRKN